LTCVANDVGLSSKDYQADLANGIECKHSYSLNKYFHKKNKKTYYRWYIRDIKNKIGEISFVGYHNGKTIRMAIPYEAYKNKKVISILTNENGIPIDGPYSKYYVKE
jgi:butyrate kinase